jgi:putative peptidoglycan lipid II flippase
VSLFKSASTVSLFTLLSRVTGLARELLIASSFGASAMTDAFNVAFRTPNLLRRLFAAHLGSLYMDIPIYACFGAETAHESA